MFMTLTLRFIAALVILIASLGAVTFIRRRIGSCTCHDESHCDGSAGRPRGHDPSYLAGAQVDANELLIALQSAGVAVWDLEIRQSAKYIAKPKYPYILGSDGAGVVAAVGAGVTRFKVGDKVYAYCWDNPKGGFYAEYVVVSTNCVAPLPKNVSLDDAGVLGASG
jgi:D-arabinose 1-dehydrogenase-like Zn-dependent alcohol dehydrogenase